MGQAPTFSVGEHVPTRPFARHVRALYAMEIDRGSRMLSTVHSKRFGSCSGIRNRITPL
jgi:hypothetical protein